MVGNSKNNISNKGSKNNIKNNNNNLNNNIKDNQVLPGELKSILIGGSCRQLHNVR